MAKGLSTLLAALFLVTGCGQLGPLYLPDEDVAPPAPEAAEEATEESEEDTAESP